MQKTKKTYEKPMMRAERFVPNVYCKVCYSIVCKTDAYNGYYNYLYNDTNDNGELDENDKLIDVGFSSFHGCNKRQGTASETIPSYNGFITNYKYSENSGGNSGNGSSGGGFLKQKLQKVYWWNAALGSSSDYHVSYDLASAKAESTNASL